MCRLTHLLEFGVGPQTISDYFAEVTEAVPCAEREALWCRSNLARGQFSEVLARIRVLVGTSEAKSFQSASRFPDGT